MKKNYLDLTLDEFLNAITNKTGALIDYLEKITEILRVDENPRINTIKALQHLDEIISDLKASDDYYFTELNDIEIYNYLAHITKGFDIERVKIILRDIDVYYNTDFLDRIKEESMNEYLKNGWEIPQKEIIFKPKQGKNAGKEIKHIIPDFKKMRNKTHIADGLSIQTAINMLKKKFGVTGITSAISDYKTNRSDLQNENLTRLDIENKPQQSVHFTRSFFRDEQKNLFNGLTSGGFLPKGVIYSHFCYVFGGTPIQDNEKPFEPLIWQKSIGLLAYCIDNLFADTDEKHWEIATKCFLWKGNIPNKDTMKNTVSKYKKDFTKKPVGYEELDTIINSL